MQDNAPPIMTSKRQEELDLALTRLDTLTAAVSSLNRLIEARDADDVTWKMYWKAAERAYHRALPQPVTVQDEYHAAATSEVVESDTDSDDDEASTSQPVSTRATSSSEQPGNKKRSATQENISDSLKRPRVSRPRVVSETSKN